MSSSAVETHETRAQSVKVSGEALAVDLVDGRTIIVPLVWFPRLWHGTPRERSHFEIFGGGRYIQWPDLDEDLTVTGCWQDGGPVRALNLWENGWTPERWPATNVARPRPTQARETPNRNGRGNVALGTCPECGGKFRRRRKRVHPTGILNFLSSLSMFGRPLPFVQRCIAGQSR